MNITKSEFTISSATVSQCPKDTKHEFAFIGRSNVGKSSLINMLCNHKGLAKTSATPGKTLLINHFIINNEWYLVDLPGYGFAKRSKTVQKKLDQMITSYILQRKQLVKPHFVAQILVLQALSRFMCFPLYSTTDGFAISRRAWRFFCQPTRFVFPLFSSSKWDEKRPPGRDVFKNCPDSGVRHGNIT